MVTIRKGPFLIGCFVDDLSRDADEGPRGGTEAQVPEFQIDTHEATVQEYMQCIKTGKCNRPRDHQRNKYCNIGAPGRDNHPANCSDPRVGASASCVAARGTKIRPNYVHLFVI